MKIDFLLSNDRTSTHNPELVTELPTSRETFAIRPSLYWG